MKRSGFLQRKTPLRSTSSLKRGEPMKRTRLRKAAPRRAKARAHMRPYVAWVRSLDCISCGRFGPSDAAHMPVGVRGMGLKAPDSSVVPLCRPCHLWFDGHASLPPTKLYRARLGAKWVAVIQAAAIPDTIEHAYDLANLGLGEVFHEAGGKWTWMPITDEGATP